LGPQAVLAAAEEGHVAAGLRGFQRLAVHVAEHQHAAVVHMLHDHGQQAVALAPVQCRRIESGCVLCHERTSTPARARCCFRSGMAMLPEWNTLAASAASTSARANTSTKCAMVPAPPDATSGTRHAARAAANCSTS